MKYVIDCSVAFKWFVMEADRPKALQLRQGFENRTCELLAPDLFPTEIGNALLMAEQGKNPRLAPGEAALFLNQLLQSLPKIFDAVPLLPRAQQVAKQYKRSVYDCLYLVLAEREQCDLVTADAKLVNALQAAFPFVVHLASLP
jgi:predicted nucleic acid-binding protein